MTEQLQDRIVARQPEPILVGGSGVRRSLRRGRSQRASDAVKKKGRRGRRRRLKGARGRGAWTAKTADFRMIQQGGAVVIQMLENVQQVTIRPLIEAVHRAGNPGIYR